MNIGVIGGSGFIGARLVNELLAQKHEVTVFDIMKPPQTAVKHIYLDITDLSKTCVALTGDLDAVYMLAAMADVNDVYSNPVEATEVNVLSVVNVLEAARRNSVGRVLFASTIWVYDLAEEDTVNEEASLSLDKANHLYTATKLAAELCCYSYQRLYGQKFTILRYGIPYGPGARARTVMAAFVNNVFQGLPLTIFGDGKQHRCFIYVDDLAKGSVAALNLVAENRVYNLGGSRPITILEVAETVRKILGKGEIVFKEGRPGDPLGKVISSLRAKEELGWVSQIEFEEGLKLYIEWYRKNQLGKEKA